MRRGQGLLGVGKRLLVELLARAQTGELDADLVVGETREANQVASEVHDQHRFAHVEHEQLAALAHEPGLQHQLARFGNRHEVAPDLGVGDGHGAAAGDLFAKLRHHAAGTAEHVAEAHDHEARGGVALQALAQHLGHALGGAHDVGRIHRLVGGNEHELADPGRGRRTRAHGSAHDIVAHRLPGVADFHERHMLVGGGVKHEYRPMLVHHRLHAYRILAVGDQGDDLEARPHRFELLLDGVERELRQFAQHQPARRKACDLAAQLRADGTAGAGDQDTMPADELPQAGVVEHDRIATEQIIELDAAQLRDGDLAVSDVVERRHRHDLHPGFGGKFDRAAAHRVRNARHGNDGGADRALRRDCRDLVDAAQHRDAVHVAAALELVVVEQADHAPLRIAPQLAQQLVGRLAGAQHQHRLAADVGKARQPAFLPGPVSETAATHHQDQQQRIEQEHRARDAIGEAQQHQGGGHGEGGRADREQDQADVVQAGIAPQPAIETGEPEHGRL